MLKKIQYDFFFKERSKRQEDTASDPVAAEPEDGDFQVWDERKIVCLKFWIILTETAFFFN